MRRVSVALISAASIITFAHIASAADLYRPAPYKAPPPPPPVQDWSGIYVGGEGGYGWGNQRFNQAFDPFFRCFAELVSGADQTLSMLGTRCREFCLQIVWLVIPETILS